MEQAREFEKSCANISAIIYTVNEENVIEIKHSSLNQFNIDSLF